MKRIASIFLALTFVLYLGGMQLMYWIKIDSAKREATAAILGHSTKSANTKDFVFTPAQYNSLNWLEKNKEFTFEGQHYDIADIEYLSNGIKVSCYTDNEETEIANAFQKFSNKLFSTHQQSGGGDNDILNKIAKEYLPLNFVLPQPISEKSISVITKENTPTLSLLIADIWHPPATC